MKDEMIKWQMGWLVIYSTGATRSKPCEPFTPIDLAVITLSDQAIARAAMTSFIDDRMQRGKL